MRGRGRLLYASLVLLALGLVVAAAWIATSGPAQWARHLTRLRPLPLAGACLLTCACVGLRWIRWRYLLRRADLRIPARSDLLIYLSSLAGRATPAYAGEALRCLLLARRHRIRLASSFALLVVERGLDLVALGALLALSTRGQGAWLAVALASIVLGLLAALAAWSIGLRLARGPHPSREFGRSGSLATSLLLTVVAWLPAAGIVSLAARGLNAPALSLADSLAIFSKATLGGAATLMPVGVGATGSIAILNLESFFDPETAVLTATLFRLVTTGFSMALGFAALAVALVPRRSGAAHFDQIAPEYAGYVGGDVWKVLIERRIERMRPELLSARSGVTLDLGCGLGAYCHELAQRGHTVVGLDGAHELLRRAAAGGGSFVQGDALALPFPDASLDFVFCVGVLHHLRDEAAQAAAVREVTRVLKPGGSFTVHETNTRNPLFRLYMGYVFPILKSVDEGTEWWIEPQRWTRQPGLEHVRTEHFTFLPDFAPRFLLPLLAALERRLEAGPLAPWSVHYMAVLRRPETGRAPAEDEAPLLAAPDAG